MKTGIGLAAITDEFSQDLDVALDAMASLGFTGVELRTIGGQNIADIDDAGIETIVDNVTRRGMTILSIASPLLKCVLPDAPDLDMRFQQDAFASRHTFADQPRLAERVFEIAERTGAPIVRVFSYWRTVDPARCFDRVVEALTMLADQAAARGCRIGLENEHACNVATAAESVPVLEAIDHRAFGLIWDPANALVAGEEPFPSGYRALPVTRIIHVHAKDCTVDGHTPTWGPIGQMGIDWAGQVQALEHDGYRGWISLETHWTGPTGDKREASLICGRALRALVADRSEPTWS